VTRLLHHSQIRAPIRRISVDYRKNELNKLPRNLKFRSFERESIKDCFVLCGVIPSCLGVTVASGLYGGMNLLLCFFLTYFNSLVDR
jgi:hypothetical protein